MDKNLWALCIGHLILAMNSIDCMTYHCHRLLAGKEPSKTWRKEPLADRLKSLVARAPNDSKLQTILRDMLDDADTILATRNLVAHGWIGIDARNPLHPGEPTKWLLLADGHAPTSLEYLVATTQNCQKLSDRISEYLAALEFKKLREVDLF